jgi:hypothetical protein
MKELKSFSFFAIPYLTVCGGLYHIAYWSTFNINGLSYIGLADLIKSFIYPFLSFIGTFFIGYFFSGFIYNNNVFPSGGGRETAIGKFLNKKWVLFILFLIWFFTLTFLYWHGEPDRWIIWAVWAEVVPTVYLNRRNLWIEYFPISRIRTNLIQAFVLIPIISFASGKYYSELILINKKYKYVIDSHMDKKNDIKNDTIKFLGDMENHLFFTNINNSKIFIIRSENVDTLRLQQFAK